MTARVSRLENGLRIATDTVQTVDTVSLGIWVDVGTRHEPAAINGAAHFLEHMAFKGTERRSARDIAEEIEAVGGHLNAYTSRESTAYYAKVLKEDVPLALDILADILQNSTFDPEELERERTVILQEIGQANDTPDDIIFDHFQECAYPEQAMGRPVLGRPEIIRELGRDAVVGYLRDHYGARRMVLAAAGNLEHERLVDLADTLLSGLPAERSVSTEPARYTGGERREDRDLEQLHLVLGFPGVMLGDADYYAASVLSTAFGGGMSSRLFQEIREKRGLCYSVYAADHAFADVPILQLGSGLESSKCVEAYTRMREIVDELREQGPTRAEVERARAYAAGRRVLAFENTGAVASYAAKQRISFGDSTDPEEAIARLDAVTYEEVCEVGAGVAAQLAIACVGPHTADELQAA